MRFSTVKNRKSTYFLRRRRFSFYPVKHITNAEGGMLITNKGVYCEKIL